MVTRRLVRRVVHKSSALHHHRHPLPPGLVSGIIYALAAIAAVAMGFVFFRHVQKARSDTAALQYGESAARGDLPPNVRIVSKKEALQAEARPTAQKAARVPLAEQPAAPLPDSGQASRAALTGAGDASHSELPIPVNDPCLLPAPSWRPFLNSVVPSEQVRLLPIADTAVIASHLGGETLNAGAATNLPIRGNDAFLLARYDVSRLRGWTILRATWSAKLGKKAKPQFGFSAVYTPWQEGGGTFETRASNGATFVWAEFGKTRWRDDELPFSYVIRGNGTAPFCHGSVLNVAGPAAQTDEWIHVEIDPALVQGMAMGLVQGLAISDEKGQLGDTWWVPSREAAQDSHYLAIEGARADVLPPGSVKQLEVSEHYELRGASGIGVILSWIAGGGDYDRGQAFAYDIRYGPDPCVFETARRLRPEYTPRPQPSGRPDRAVIDGLLPKTKYVFFVRAMDESGQQSPIAECRHETREAAPLPEMSSPPAFAAGQVALLGGAVRLQVLEDLQPLSPFAESEKGAVGNLIWDRNARTLRLRAAREETLGFVFQLGRGTTGTFPIVRITPEPWSHPKHALDAAPSFHRVWFSRSERPDGRASWAADALLPLTNGVLDVSQPDNRIPNAACHYVFGELHIPDSAPPGRYVTRWTFSDTAGRTDAVNVVLEVLPYSLRKDPKFTVELTVSAAMTSLYKRGASGAPDALGLEEKYSVLAAAHRCFLAIPAADQAPWAPPVSGRGQELKIGDWETWDRRMTIAASAASVVWRGHQQPHIVLPVSELWPMELRSSFRCAERLAKSAGGHEVYAGEDQDVGDCVQPEYWAGLRRALSALRSRDAGKGIAHHVWLTGVTGMPDRWTPWNLGAPMFRSDFQVLNAFCRTIRGGAGESNTEPPVLIRTTIADPALLPHADKKSFDVLCVSNLSFAAWLLCRTRRFETGEKMWVCSPASPPERGAAGAASHVLRCAVLGADGWSVDDALGRPEDWMRSAARSLLYCGAPMGAWEPYPSLRLKAIRRAWQDLVYLRMLSDRRGWSREEQRDFMLREWPALRETDEPLGPDQISALRAKIQSVLSR